MGFFSKMFSKKATNIANEARKVENRDLMQALVGGSLLVAYADGECEEAELEKMEKIISALPELKDFGSEISETIGNFRSQLEAGFRIGRQKILNEINDVKGDDDERMLVFNIMVTIAEADGEVEPEEAKVLKEVGQRLGINLREYGIE